MKRLLWQLKLIRLQGSAPLRGSLGVRSWVSVTAALSPHRTSITVDVTSGIHKRSDLVDFQIGLPNNRWELIELTRRFGSALASEDVYKWAKLGMLDFISRTVRDALKQPTTCTNSENVSCLMKFRTLIPELDATGELIVRGTNFVLDRVRFTTHQLFMAWFLDHLGYELVVMERRNWGWKILGPLGSFRSITAAPDRRLGVTSVVLKETVYVPHVSLTHSAVRSLQLLELFEQLGRE